MLALVVTVPLLLLAGCEPEPPPAIDEVDWAAASGPALLRFELGVITLDGHHVGELREPGVLRQSRHRKLLKALKLRSGQDPDSHDPPEQALLSQGWPLRLEAPPDAVWEDIYPLVATASWAGFGPFELVELPAGLVSVGPLAPDTRQPAAWAGEPILGVQPVLELALGSSQRCAQLHFDVLVEAPGDDPLSALRQLPQLLRSLGSEPLVDCAAVYADQPSLQAACDQARQPRSDASELPPSIASGQRGLPAAAFDTGVPGRVILAPTQDVPLSAVLAAIQALSSGGTIPVIALNKPAASEDMTCPQAKVHTIDGVLLAGARWLGEHHQPNR